MPECRGMRDGSSGVGCLELLLRKAPNDARTAVLMARTTLNEGGQGPENILSLHRKWVAVETG